MTNIFSPHDKDRISFRYQLTKSFLGVGAVKLLSVPISFLSSVILARALGPDSFGKYAFVMAVIPLLALPTTGCVAQLLTRQIANYSHACQWPLCKGIVRGGYLWVLVFSVVLMGGGFIAFEGFDLLALDPKWSGLFLALLLLPLWGTNSVWKGAIKGYGFPAFAEFPTEFIQPLGFLILLSIATFYGGGLSVARALWAQIGAAVFSFGFATYLFFKIKPTQVIDSVTTYEFKKWFVSLMPFTLIALVSTLNSQVGIVLLGFLMNDESVAAMRVADRGSQFVFLSLSLVNMVISPQIVKCYREKNTKRLQKLSRESARGAFILALPVGLVLMFWGKELIVLTFGERYEKIAYCPLVILVVGQLVNVFCGSVGQFLAMCGHEKDTLWGQIAALMVNVILCSLLIPSYGTVGAALGVSIGLITWNVVLAFLFIRRLGIRPTAF